MLWMCIRITSGEILKIIHFYHFDSDPRFPPFLLMLGGNLGSHLYGDVSVMLSARHKGTTNLCAVDPG